MFKVECRRCGKELDVPGALAFGVPDTDGSVNKHHICVFCWDELLCWLYNDGDVVVPERVGRDVAVNMRPKDGRTMVVSEAMRDRARTWLYNDDYPKTASPQEVNDLAALLQTVSDEARHAAILRERLRVVSWLRETGRYDNPWCLGDVADAIARCDHVTLSGDQ